MAEEHDPDPMEGDDSERTPDQVGPEENRPKDRREFLRQLGTMSFLTAAVIRGAVPLHAAQDDSTLCGSIKQGQVVHQDVDCTPAPVSSGNHDADCGLFSGEEWARHEDNDCYVQNELATYSDLDCGKLKSQAGTFDTYHRDNACSSLGELASEAGDSDCHLIRTSSAVHKDDDCWPLSQYHKYQDLDCGYANGGANGGRHSDNDCSKYGSPNASVDSDCSMSGYGSNYHQDSHCTTETSDLDCGLKAGHLRTYVDNDCHVPEGGGSSTDNHPNPPGEV